MNCMLTLSLLLIHPSSLTPLPSIVPPPVLFLRLEPLAADGARFVGRQVDEDFCDISRVGPFVRVFLWLCGAVHHCVHVARINPVDSYAALFQFRSPGL